jgi:uncharacterized membrane protein SpoIIM required for sporulation
VRGIESNPERIKNAEDALTFGAFLFTHNIQVTFLAFSLCALTLIGGMTILFYNGMILGAVAGMYLLDGEALFFFAWVGPHGALELPAIVFGGAAGLRLGKALFAPGIYSTASALRAAFTPVWRMLVWAMTTLVFAGMIEGSFSQFSAKTVPYPFKLSFALLLFIALLAFLFYKRKTELTAEVRR